MRAVGGAHFASPTHRTRRDGSISWGGPCGFPSHDGDGYALVPVAAPSSRTDRMSTSVLVQICRDQLGIDFDWHEMRGNLHLQCVTSKKVSDQTVSFAQI